MLARQQPTPHHNTPTLSSSYVKRLRLFSIAAIRAPHSEQGLGANGWEEEIKPN